MYGIGAAAKLSGVHAETIRMWERRHRLPRPHRTEGGHRQYTDRDIAVLRAIKILLDSGARIGGVAELDEDEILSAAAGHEGPAADAGYDTLVESMIAAAKNKDAQRAEEILDRPLLQRHAMDVIAGFYLPLLARVGDLWLSGELDVASEHFVEKLVSGRVHAVLANKKSPAGAPVAVCACPRGERHELGLLAASVQLKDAGFEVVHLGADVPTADLVTTIRLRTPALVVLAVTIAPEAALATEVAQALTAADVPRVPVVVGGAAAGVLATALGTRATPCPDVQALAGIARRIATRAG